MKWVIGGVVLLIVVFLMFLFYTKSLESTRLENMVVKQSEQTKSESEEPFSAYFVIYTNGTLRNFEDTKYHERSPDAFLLSDDPQVIHVIRRGVTWGDFFDTLPFSLKEDCLTTGTGQVFCDGQGGELTYVLNEQVTEGVLSQAIGKGDRLLVTFGTNPDRINQELSILESRD